ncbi:hypothetical protein [Ferroplasma acidiphilum]|jgi:hypothetical protein|uniref:hypothetical protein n=1 Tax=Ferroplasma acidiphilum TaxID=74969 RepID=UPI002814A2BF|nr:hypothetical protein [Ferroplasma acidiphilum]WMT53781.1 MAG: hypothetical protein RE473_02780 [Ferroplasma acidiphilum]
MIDECKPNKHELKWAASMFKEIGGDKSYFVDLDNVQKAMISGTPGKAAVMFLNHWRIRREKVEIPSKIDEWYTDKVAKQLTSLPNTLTKANLNDNEVRESIIELYNNLCEIHGIEDTSASMILHILKPDLFVMWNKSIREHYIGNAKKTKVPGEYIMFLRKIQEIAICLESQNSNIPRDISPEINDSTENFVGDGKTITKLIDEYNWIVYKKKITVPPT